MAMTMNVSRGRGRNNPRNQPASSPTGQFNRNRTVLKTHESVVADILDTADGDLKIIQMSNRFLEDDGNIRHFEVTWESANELKSEIEELREQRRIDAENARAERIANAVGSAVVVIPTTRRAFGIMVVVAIGLGTLLFSRKPWTTSGLLNAIVDTALYGGAFLLSCYHRQNDECKVRAQGAVKQESLNPLPPIAGVLTP